jgi:hypothetical protein
MVMDVTPAGTVHVTSELVHPHVFEAVATAGPADRTSPVATSAPMATMATDVLIRGMAVLPDW